jgi:Aminomethyltransferase folate-binding domain
VHPLAVGKLERGGGGRAGGDDRGGEHPGTGNLAAAAQLLGEARQRGEVLLQLGSATNVPPPRPTLPVTSPRWASSPSACRSVIRLITSAAAAERDADHIRCQLPPGCQASLTDVTSAYSVYGVMGPASRQLLSRLTDSDLAEGAFPFGSSRLVDLGYARVRATQITYVGELGWELCVPVEFAVGVYGDLMTAGAELGVTNAGYYAIQSLRLEKGYRAFGRELTPDHNPVEAGLMFACKLAGSVAFLGVNVGGRLVSATVGLRPPFDPDGTKVRSA